MFWWLHSLLFQMAGWDQSSLPALLASQATVPPLSSLLTEEERALLPADTSSFLQSQLVFFANSKALLDFKARISEFVQTSASQPYKELAAVNHQLVIAISSWIHQATVSRRVASILLLEAINSVFTSAPDEWSSVLRTAITSTKEETPAVLEVAMEMNDLRPSRKKKDVGEKAALQLCSALQAAAEFNDHALIGQPFWVSPEQDLSIRAAHLPLLECLSLIPDLCTQLLGDCSALEDKWPRFLSTTAASCHPLPTTPWSGEAWKASLLGYHKSSIADKMAHGHGHPQPSYATLLQCFSPQFGYKLATNTFGKREFNADGTPSRWILSMPRLLLVALASSESAYAIINQRLYLKFLPQFKEEESLLSRQEVLQQMALFGLLFLATSHYTQRSKNIIYPSSIVSPLRGAFSIPSYRSRHHDDFTRLVCWDSSTHDPANAPFILSAADINRLPQFTREPQAYLAADQHRQSLLLFDTITGRVSSALQYMAEATRRRDHDHQSTRKRRNQEDGRYSIIF